MRDSQLMEDSLHPATTTTTPVIPHVSGVQIHVAGHGKRHIKPRVNKVSWWMTRTFTSLMSHLLKSRMSRRLAGVDMSVPWSFALTRREAPYTLKPQVTPERPATTPNAAFPMAVTSLRMTSSPQGLAGNSWRETSGSWLWRGTCQHTALNSCCASSMHSSNPI